MGQRGVMVWFTGLSGSGKSTLAIALERELYKRGLLCRILDGDNIRSGINNNLGFSEADRTENIRRIAEVAKLFVDCGIVTIAAFISPTEAIREMAADIIGNSGTDLDFVDNAYRMSQDDYLWWSDYLDMIARYNDQLDALREQYGTAVDDIIARPELSLSDDYTAHEQELQALVDAIRDELGE